MPDSELTGRAGHWRTITEAGIQCRLWINDPPDVLQVDIDRTGLFYEAPALRLVQSLLPPAPRIVDVGANFGNHSVFFSRICRASWLLPLEPNPKLLPELRANLSANSCPAELAHLGVAIGAERGELYLRLDPADADIRNRGGTRLVQAADDATDVAVPVMPLDELVSDSVDLIKIDVEGMGVDVLRGATRLIARCAPLIFIEVGIEEMPAFFDWLRAAPYRVAGALSDYVGLTNLLLQPTTDHPAATAGPADQAAARIAEALAEAAAAKAHAARADASLAAALERLDGIQKSSAKAIADAKAAAERELPILRNEITRLRIIEQGTPGGLLRGLFGRKPRD
jgi:FkbM family methyltransferase